MRCSKCGENCEALFYPNHTSARKPKRNEFKCCMNCKVEKFRPVTSPGVDTAEMMEKFRKDGN